jgi:hypothetical protein
MPKWPKQSMQEMNAFYGNPDANQDGVADPTWANTHLIKIVPPYDLFYPIESDGKIVKRAKKFTGLWVNKACADSLLSCLGQINDSFTADEIRKYELDLCGGVYVFKKKTGGSGLSTHAWGAAIDLSHLINGWKVKYDPQKGMMPKKVVDIFDDEGWTWGGVFTNADAMHFQAADL